MEGFGQRDGKSIGRGESGLDSEIRGKEKEHARACMLHSVSSIHRCVKEVGDT